jgi:SAM-dependent methyltransferase
LEPVESIYGDQYFFGGGVGYPNYLAEQDLLLEHGRRYARLMQAWMPAGSVLDVGAAAGFVVKGMAQHGWQPFGLEPNAHMATYGREHLDVPLTVGTLESFAADRTFDLITMFQVIAHFRDLRRALHVAASLTRPGGYWLIETWNYRSLLARILGRQWHEWSPPSVLHWFSPQSLVALARQHRMQFVTLGRPSKRLSGDHARSLLKAKLSNSRIARWIGSLLDATIPGEWAIPYPAADLFWILLRSPPAASDQVA